jgi:methanogenic corrinoid protein MtbC1
MIYFLKEGEMMEHLKRSAATLAPVPPDAAREFRTKMKTLREQVNRELSDDPAVEGLIGFNSINSVFDRSRYYAAFMANVFSYNAFALMAQNAAWAYQAYNAHGFAYEYFPVEVNAWMRAADQHLEAAAGQAINTIFLWRLNHHQDLMAISGNSGLPLALNPSWDQEREVFLQRLLSGDYRECLHLTDWTVTDSQGLEDFYLQVVQPCMYQVGNLWQRGEISVAQEHLASAIVDRVMAATYPRVALINVSKGKVVIMTAPDELHEIGARVVADCLGIDGWDVNYLGVNTPLADLLGFLVGSKPFLLAISLAVPCNLIVTQELVRAMRNHPELKKTRIMVGGRLFLPYPELWAVTGADGWAPDAKVAVALARQWWEEK